MDENKNYTKDVEEKNITQDEKTSYMANNEVHDEKNNRRNSKPKRKIKKQTVIFIILIIVCILLTAVVTIIKIKNINNSLKSDKEDDKNDMFVEEVVKKKQAEDTIYLVSGLEDTYNNNDLVINKINVQDGNIVEKINYQIKNGNTMEYLSISGLKDKEIENKINEDIKNNVYNIIEKNPSQRNQVSVRVMGNFSNVLSISGYKNSMIWSNNQWSTVDTQNFFLNYDLTTGSKLSLEDLFISSTSINSIISEAAYRSMAWDTNLSLDDMESYQKNQNMDNRDTSQYEEKILEIISNYKKNKDSLSFYFTPTTLNIFGFPTEYDKTTRGGSVNLMDYMDSVAIYKKYANKDIFESNNIGLKNIYVFTIPIPVTLENSDCIYGKLNKRLFVDVSLAQKYEEILKQIDGAVIDKVISDGNGKTQNIVNNLKNISNNSDSGYVYQGYCSVGYYDGKGWVKKKPHITIDLIYCQSEMSATTFDNEIFKKLAKKAIEPKSSIDGMFLGEYDQKTVDGITSELGRKVWYYDLNGNYIGDDESVVTIKNNKNSGQS